MTLPNKIAVVTGASKGIGRAIAIRFAKEGADVLINYCTDRNGANITAREVQETGRKALIVQGDVSKSSDVNKMVELGLRTFGRIDILVNNAGVSSMANMTELEERDWDFNMDINARGPFLCSKAVAKHMMEQRSGKIINNASLAAKRGARFLAHYSASKFAVLGLTYSMAIELAPYNITVNAVCPGIVETDMVTREWKWEGSIRKVAPGQIEAEYLAEIPLGRFCQPEDVAGVVAFLASKDADYLTGQAINVNGGMENH